MDRKRPDSGWRVAAFAAALFAITLNFLQPLVHAALMRDGGPANWASLCQPGFGQDDQQNSTPAAGKLHECCLGLAHSLTLAPPSTAFMVVELSHAIVNRPLPAADVLSPVGIRDGPNQPRAPPSLV
jgi:hypothetical protein